MPARESAFEHEFQRLQILAESFVSELNTRLPEIRQALELPSDSTFVPASRLQHAAQICHGFMGQLIEMNKQQALVEEALRRF
jgi:hypothetical protein